MIEPYRAANPAANRSRMTHLADLEPRRPRHWLIAAPLAIVVALGLGPAALVYAMLRGDEDANHLAAEAKVLPAGVDLPEGAPKRAMRVTEFNGVFQVRSDLTGNDVVYKYQAGAANNNKRCKEYLVDLEAGKDYVIDLESNQFDAFLRLGQLNGAQIAVDDDSGGNLNSRIRFTPVESGTYVITATALNAGFGPFTLTVRETRFKKPR